jgi:hypothetical protein
VTRFGKGRSASIIYTVAATACPVAPALALTTTDPRAVWPSVLLGGVPLSAMAILLALIHAKHRLIDGVYRATAFAWATAVILVGTPFDAWELFQGAAVVHWARIIATALVALLFGGLIVRAWTLPWKQRLSLTIGFGSVALFFGSLASRYVFPMEGGGLEAESEALAEFFFNAVGACVLLLPGLAVPAAADARR